MYSKIIISLFIVLLVVPLVTSSNTVSAEYDTRKPKLTDDHLFCIVDFNADSHEKLINSFIYGLEQWQKVLPKDFVKFNYVIVRDNDFKYGQCTIIVHFEQRDTQGGNTYTTKSPLSNRYLTSMTIYYEQYCHVYIDNCIKFNRIISMHEIGHVLGLVHDNIENSIMNNQENTLTLRILEKNIQDVINFYTK